MDSDFWTSRLVAAKRQFINHHQQNNRLTSQLDRMNMDDIEVEEVGRPDFPCPYCYEEFDVASLCLHLEDEHSSESRVTVCPICAVKVARDMLSHITTQHGHLFRLQRRRRLRRVAIPDSQTLSLLGRDLREAHLQVLLGGGAYRSSNTASSTPPVDPLVSSLIMNYPASEADELSKAVTSYTDDVSTKGATPQNIWKSSFDSSLSAEEREKQMRQAAGKAFFMQDLVVSTLLTE